MLISRFVPALLLLGALAAVGVWMFHAQRDRRIQATGNDLSAIAGEKATTMAAWMRMKTAEASALVNTLLEGNGGSDQRRRENSALFEALFALPDGWKDFRTMTVVGADGKILQSIPAAHAPSESVAARLLSLAGSPENPQMVFGADGDSLVACVVRLHPASAHDGEVAAVVFTLGRMASLGPIVDPSGPEREWTGLILAECGDGAPKIIAQSAPSRGIAGMERAADSLRARAFAAVGAPVQAVDARGNAFLVVSRSVGSTPLRIAAGMRMTDVLRDVAKASWYHMLMIGLIVAAFVAGAYSLRVRWRLREARERLERETEHEVLVKHYDLLSRHANDAILLFGEGGRIIEANLRAVEIYRYSDEELKELTIDHLRMPDAHHDSWKFRKAGGTTDGEVFEAVHRRKDGSVFLAEESVRTIESSGKVFYQSIVRDITARRQAEDAVRAAEERYRLLFEGAGAGISYYDVAGNLVLINTEAARHLGLIPEHIVGKNVLEFLSSSEAEGLLARINATVSRGTSTVSEVEYRISGGSRWFLSTYQPIRNSADVVVGVQVISQDITRIKEMESDMRSSEERFEKSFRLSPDAMMIGKRNGGLILDVNQSWERLFGIARSEVIGTSALVLPIVGDDEQKARWADVWSRPKGVRDVEAVIANRNGGERQVAISSETIVIKDEPCALLLFRDLTERRRAEEALRTSERRFRLLAERARDAIYRMSLPSGQFEYITPAVREITGYTAEEFYVAPQLFRSVLHPDFRDIFMNRWGNMLKGDAPAAFEFMIIHKNGSVRWLNQRNTLIRDDRGVPIAIEAVVTDVTERKMQEQALVESERKYRTLVESMAAGVIHTDADRKIRFVNEVFCHAVGYTERELLGAVAPDILAADGEAGELLRRMMAPRDDGKSEEYEVRMRTKNGEVRWMRIDGSPLRDDGGAVVGCVSVQADVTERKRLEETIQGLQVALDQLSDVVFMTTAEGSITYVNPAFVQMYGYAPADVIGKTPRVLKSGKMEETYYREFWKRISGGQRVRGEHINRAKDGRTVVVEASVSPVRSEDGRIMAFIAVQHELNEPRMKTS